MLGHQLDGVITVYLFRYWLPIQQDLPAGPNRLPTRQYPPQGGLAMAARGGDAEPFARFHRQRQSLPEGTFPLGDGETSYFQHYEPMSQGYELK